MRWTGVSQSTESLSKRTPPASLALARSRDGFEAGDADEVDAVAVTGRVEQVMP